MGGQVVQAAKKLELAALGRPATREDWIRDIWLRVGVVFFGGSDHDVMGVLSDRLKFRSAYARPALDEILVTLETRPDGFLAEIRKVRENLERASTIDLNEPTFAAEVLYGHLEVEAEDLLAQTTEIAEEWQAFQEYLDAKGEAIPNIPRLLRAMCRETGSERTSLGRDLKNIFLTLLNSPQDLPPIFYLTYSWICAQSTDTIDEVITTLTHATKSVAPSISSYLSCRLLSEIYQREGQLARALEWSKRAVEQHNTSEANVELALLAAEMHENMSAKTYVEEALTRRPISVVGLLSDDRSISLSHDLLDVVVRVQARLRRDGRGYITNWVTAAKEILEVQRNYGSDLMIPHELLEGHKLIEERLAQADILTAGYLMRYCAQCATELKAVAKSSLEREFDRKRESLAQARLAIDSVATARDAKMQTAKAENDQRIQTAKLLTKAVEAKGKDVERQSTLWFGSGCGLFAMYMITKFVTNMIQTSIELSTGLGIVLMLIAGIPIVLAIGIQVTHGLNRAAAEVAMRDKIADATKKYGQAELEANDFHREQLAIGRKHLAEVEADLRKIETALRAFSPDVSKNQNTSPRLRAA